MTADAAIDSGAGGEGGEAGAGGAATGGEGGGEAAFAIPEQYADRAWAGNVKSLDDLYSQHDNVQTMIGKKSVPGADATDEQLQEYYGQLRPETFEGYDLQLPEGVEAEINTDDQNKYKEFFHSIGLTPRQANDLFQFHVGQEGEKAAGQQTAKFENEDAFNAELDKAYGSREEGDAAIKIMLEHAILQSPETKQLIADLPNDQLLAVLALTNSMHKKIPSKAEEGAPGTGEGAGKTVASMDQKVAAANKLRMDPKIKDPFHPEHHNLRQQLKTLDDEIQRGHK